MRSMILAGVMLSIASGASQAQLAVIPGPVEADVLKVTDGDTFAFVAFPFPEQATRGRLRVDGIDTPERNGKCAEEKNKAEQAKLFVEAMIRETGGRVWLYTVGLEGEGGGGFGRYRAQVKIGNKWLSDELIKKGLARENHGEKRGAWC
jgi:micrococcal nuclease